MDSAARAAQALRAADERLAEAVAERLAQYEPLRASRAQIAVAVKGRVVHLSGMVRSATQPHEAARIARTVAGVSEVHVEGLRTDAHLAVDVATALAQDPELARATLRVQVALGAVTLRGAVGQARLLDRAVARAAAVAGVRAVRNEVVLGREAPAIPA